MGVPWRRHQEISQRISSPSGILDPGGSLGDIVGIPWGIPSRESLVGYPGGYLANLIYPKGALAIPWGTRPPIAPRVPRDHTRTLHGRPDKRAHCWGVGGHIRQMLWYKWVRAISRIGNVETWGHPRKHSRIIPQGHPRQPDDHPRNRVHLGATKGRPYKIAHTCVPAIISLYSGGGPV